MEPQLQPRKDTDPWLVYTLSNHSEKLNGLDKNLSDLTKEVKKINGSLRDEISRSRLADSVHDQQIDRQKERLEEHKKGTHGNPKPNNPSSNESFVSFKWIADNAASIATGVITAIVVTALIAWATGMFN